MMPPGWMWPRRRGLYTTTQMRTPTCGSYEIGRRAPIRHRLHRSNIRSQAVGRSPGRNNTLVSVLRRNVQREERVSTATACAAVFADWITLVRGFGHVFFRAALERRSASPDLFLSITVPVPKTTLSWVTDNPLLEHSMVCFAVAPVFISIYISLVFMCCRGPKTSKAQPTLPPTVDMLPPVHHTILTDDGCRILPGDHDDGTTDSRPGESCGL